MRRPLFLILSAATIEAFTYKVYRELKLDRMKRVILVRHGESEINAVWKEKAIFCGQINTPLTEKGRQQARDVGSLMSDTTQFRISHSVSSTLARAVDTLELIRQQFSAPPTLLPAMSAFNERSLGLFEGRSKDDVYREFPEYENDPAFCNFRDDYHQKAPGGENLSEVTARAWPTMESLFKSAESDILIVAHCQVIRCLIARATKLAANEVGSLKIPHAVPLVLTPAAFNEWQFQAIAV